jgi:hypothetical protein
MDIQNQLFMTDQPNSDGDQEMRDIDNDEEDVDYKILNKMNADSLSNSQAFQCHNQTCFCQAIFYPPQ